MTLHPYNKRMWGDVLLALMDECMTTSQLAYHLESRLDEVRQELIVMHHFDLVCPIGIRSDGEEPYAGSFYYRDIVWETTDHTKEHSETNPNCHGCWVREQLVTVTEVLYE
jgi:hypothetical protein